MNMLFQLLSLSNCDLIFAFTYEHSSQCEDLGLRSKFLWELRKYSNDQGAKTDGILDRIAHMDSSNACEEVP